MAEESCARGRVGIMDYEIRGRLVKRDLRRIVFHLLTVCDDFDPSDFEKVRDVWGPTPPEVPIPLGETPAPAEVHHA